MLNDQHLVQKHREALFPPITSPSTAVLAQAALFVTLRDLPQSPPPTASSPWIQLASRRFGGDVHERAVHLREESETTEPISVRVKTVGAALYDITVTSGSSTDTLSNVSARLTSPTTVETTLKGQSLRTTVVAQPPPPAVPASAAPHTQERLHVFHAGRKTTLVVPAPHWLLSLGGDVLDAAQAKGALRAPMPSLVVEVRVAVGDRVRAGDAVVVLESMKTETVLRASRAGVVRLVGCAKGEMVEEGRELVDIEAESDE